MGQSPQHFDQLRCRMNDPGRGFFRHFALGRISGGMPPWIALLLPISKWLGDPDSDRILRQFLDGTLDLGVERA